MRIHLVCFVVVMSTLLLSAVALAEPNIGAPGAHARRMANPEFAAYQDRREARWAYANANKGKILARIPTRTWTAIKVDHNPAMPRGNFIEKGRIWQPPIPRRRTLVDVLDDYLNSRSSLSVPRI